MDKLGFIVSFLLISGVVIFGLTVLYGLWNLLLRLIPSLQHWANRQITDCERRWNNPDNDNEP